jgi:hypothetical protein
MAKEKEQDQEQQAQQPASEAAATVSGASASEVTPTVIEGATPEDAISQAQSAIGNAAKKGERLCASPLARSCTSGKYVIRLTKL